jgi:hypothetical protein
MTKISFMGPFSPKIPKIPIGLAGSRKTHERFRAYLPEGSMDKYQVYLKQQRRTLFTKNLERNALKGSDFQQHKRQRGNPSQISLVAVTRSAKSYSISVWKGRNSFRSEGQI